MASRVTTGKKNPPALSGGRAARVEGQPRRVEQLSRGPRERGLEQRRTPGAGAPQPGALPPLQPVQPRELGASTRFYALAPDLGRIALITAPVPPAPARRRTALSVGHSLVRAALHRALGPHRTRALAAWYAGTGLARRVPAAPEALSSQRVWDPRHLCAAPHFAPRQRERRAKRHARFPRGERGVVDETPNSYPVSPPFTRRPRRPPRGRTKPKRAALRQGSWALVVEEERGLPLYSRCSAGQGTAGVARGARRSGLLRPGRPRPAPARLTVVRDKGQGSLDHFTALPQAQLSFLAAVPAGGGGAVPGAPAGGAAPAPGAGEAGQGVRPGRHTPGRARRHTPGEL
jgi:hypothetical protein